MQVSACLSRKGGEQERNLEYRDNIQKQGTRQLCDLSFHWYLESGGTCTCKPVSHLGQQDQIRRSKRLVPSCSDLHC